MIYLFSDEGRQALRTVASRPILYAFDFDGTLAKISPDRSGVKLSPSTHEWLHELASRASCTIVSGRALSDLTPRVNGAVPYLIGNHGLESPLTPASTLNSAEHVCLGWMKQVETDLAQPLKAAGIEVETKRYTLTFHYCGTNESTGVEVALALLLNRLTPAPQLICGKASVNALPPGSTRKGEAAHSLMTHLRCAGLFFVGDDETDEDVFELTEGLIMGVRVGPQAESQAQYYLKHQSEIEEVIRFLVHRIDRTPETPDRRTRQSGRFQGPAGERS
ncbi:MAG: trehalose-phosphatase [Nitrospira sp.]|nr:trehalose-phosphatase [Nitrospira sp.]MBH0183167.1 trehalose-phosphatase [Nitrospira sp.]MBH0184083.1 trehalose-phosphatase [Nitrospira sp.]